MIALALAAALAAAPAQRIEAETLHPGTVVADARASGGRALALSRAPVRVTVSAPAPTRVRIVARAPRCSAQLRVGSHRARLRRGGYRTVTVPLRPAFTLRRGSCGVRVDRIDVVWTPPPIATWQWQLSGAFDASVPAEIYDLDLFETSTRTIADLHARGARVVCYFSAGTRERGRPDPYPERVAGKALDDYPDERWLDVRELGELGAILRRRLDLCARKGFDGAEPDNVDGYANDTGFALRAGDQLRFNRFIARAAHARGLAVALKNDVEQAAALARDFDFALVEQCFQYDECDRLRPFTRTGKAVWAVEYELSAATFCPAARAAGFMAMRKPLELGPEREPCW